MLAQGDPAQDLLVPVSPLRESIRAPGVQILAQTRSRSRSVEAAGVHPSLGELLRHDDQDVQPQVRVHALDLAQELPLISANGAHALAHREQLFPPSRGASVQLLAQIGNADPIGHDVPEYPVAVVGALRRELPEEPLPLGLHEGRLVRGVLSQAHLTRSLSHLGHLILRRRPEHCAGVQEPQEARARLRLLGAGHPPHHRVAAELDRSALAARPQLQ